MAFGPVFPRMFSPTFDRRAAVAAAAADWWTVAGKTVIAAYQPKGAASLGASYTNLANPGTNDAAPIVAPGLDADGWSCDGTQYLDSGIVLGPASTVLARFSNATLSGSRTLFGGTNNAADRGAAVSVIAGSYATYFIYGTNAAWRDPPTASGVLGLAGPQPYADGVAQGTPWTPWEGALDTTMAIGAWHVGGTYQYPFIGSIQALVIFAETLTAGEVATVAAAMAAL